MEHTDVTAQFLETARRWLRHGLELEPELRASLGPAIVDQQLADRTDMVTAIEEGLLMRSLLVAAAPAAVQGKGPAPNDSAAGSP